MKSIDAHPLTTTPETKKIKALALLSGGLDSHLAIKVVQEQGVEVEALNFITTFCNCTSRAGGCIHEATKASKSLGIKLKTINFSADLLQSVKQPKYGYGRNLNPCIDCRVTMFKEAKRYMSEIGADFLITGEVLDSRPMSQTKSNILFIESESGLDGLILRPLSAKDFKPTVAESKGWVDRDQLFGIKGRTRKRQIKLADELGVIDYPCPAGGCLLTDPEFSYKLRDLITNESDFGIEDVKLLKYGRHFRIAPHAKIIVGRNENDNAYITRATRNGDLLFIARDLPGPVTLLRSREASEDQIKLAANMTVAYCGSDQITGVQSREVIVDITDREATSEHGESLAATSQSLQVLVPASTVRDKACYRKYLIKVPDDSLKRRPRERRKTSASNPGEINYG